MRRKKERSKQGQTNKQGKATQHTHVHDVLHVCICTHVHACFTITITITIQGFFELKTKCNFYSKMRAQCSIPQVYMAPEAIERFEFTATADVYSFGE